MGRYLSQPSNWRAIHRSNEADSGNECPAQSLIVGNKEIAALVRCSRQLNSVRRLDAFILPDAGENLASRFIETGELDAGCMKSPPVSVRQRLISQTQGFYEQLSQGQRRNDERVAATGDSRNNLHRSQATRSRIFHEVNPKISIQKYLVQSQPSRNCRTCSSGSTPSARCAPARRSASTSANHVFGSVIVPPDLPTPSRTW